jgi:hypothetical protein
MTSSPAGYPSMAAMGMGPSPAMMMAPSSMGPSPVMVMAPASVAAAPTAGVPSDGTPSVDMTLGEDCMQVQAKRPSLISF